MITMTLTLDKRRVKKDNSYPLVFRISCNGVSRDISTGYSVWEKDWNPKTNLIKESHPMFLVLYNDIAEKKVKYLNRILEFQKRFPNEKNTQIIKEFILSKPKELITVYDFWQDEINLLYQCRRDGGAQIYKESLIAIQKLKSLQISFEKVDYSFLIDLEAKFISTNVKQNTISLKLRTFRAIYNKAIKAKIATYENYPFRDFKIKKGVTTPRPIPLIEMQAYFQLKIDKTSYLYQNWLIGKLMFMLIGINFKDLIMLSEANIMGDRVIYSRAKTKTMYSIKLLEDAKTILNNFAVNSTHTLLGKLTKQDLDNTHKLTLIVRQRNKVFNAHLNKLGKMAGCTRPLTGYVFRYSWANIAKQLGYGKDLIAEALGHQYGNKVTGIYLEGYDTELIDVMNFNVYSKVAIESD